jgi:hypothetical protein
VSEVPVYSPAGRLLSWAPLEWCERHAPHLRLVRTRRGVLKRAMLRSDDGGLVEWLEASGRRSSYGRGYQQHLPCGRVVWALKGVRGSSRWGASGSPAEPAAAIWDTARDTRLEAESEMEYRKKYPKRSGLVSASY